MEFAPFPPVDRISKLPAHIVDQILMCLPTHDAVKTSILSKQWRYKWVQLPHLIFDYELWQEFRANEKSDRMGTLKFLLFAYQVLLRHQGPITKFSLINQDLEGCSEIDHLINFLLKYGIGEFTLEIKHGSGYHLPSSLFMYLKLKRLSIFGCLINPPPTFKGFEKLVRLELTYIDIDADVLQSLISSCPILEQLVLDLSIECDHLEIDAPMLRLLELNCFYSSIYIKRSPHLATITVCASCDDINNNGVGDVDFSKYGKCNFFEFFDSLPALHKLCTDSYILQILAADQVQTRHPVSSIHLKILDLSCMHLDSLNELSWVLCLICCSPNLEKMNIVISSREATDASQVLDFVKVQDYSDVLLNQLEEVKLGAITGSVSEMKLIKLLLEKSPKLKRMVIWQHFSGGPSTEKVNMILKELNKFERASPNAMVIYKQGEWSKN